MNKAPELYRTFFWTVVSTIVFSLDFSHFSYSGVFSMWKLELFISEKERVKHHCENVLVELQPPYEKDRKENKKRQISLYKTKRKPNIGTYSTVQKGHKTKQEYTNGEYLDKIIIVQKDVVLPNPVCFAELFEFCPTFNYLVNLWFSRILFDYFSLKI